jgi:ketosteroid isomerase-like protein
MGPPHRAFASAALAGTFAWALAGSAVAQQQPAPARPAQDIVKLRQDVMAVERAFAKTMADRDLAAFTRYLSAETVWSGGQGPLVGPDAVVAAWKKHFEGPIPPFSWEPDSVEVMATGQLAISTGPVRDPAGKVFGRFHSAWRQEAPGVWRIVLDMGTPHCDCPRP